MAWVTCVFLSWTLFQYSFDRLDLRLEISPPTTSERFGPQNVAWRFLGSFSKYIAELFGRIGRVKNVDVVFAFISDLKMLK